MPQPTPRRFRCAWAFAAPPLITIIRRFVVDFRKIGFFFNNWMCTPPSMPTGLTSRPPGLFCRTSRPLYCGGGLNCPPRFIWGPCFDQGAGLCAISLLGPIYADTPIYDRLTLMAVYICIHNGPNQFIVRSSLLYFSFLVLMGRLCC